MPARRISRQALTYAAGVKSSAKKSVAASTIQAAWRRRRNKPSRLYAGKRIYNQTRRITSAVMKNISESKYAGVRKDCLESVAKPLGTIRPMSYFFLNTGSTIAGLHPEFAIPLNLFKFKQGTDGDQRVGEYMYLKHCYLKMEVQCPPIDVDPSTSPGAYSNAPLRCRLMVVKANRKNNKYGQSPAPASSLFIDTQNGQFGYDETTGSINLLMKQPINKRKWLVYKDTSFTLTPPLVTDFAETLPVYAPGRGRSTYRCNVKLPIYKKTHFDDGTDTPDDVDTQWMIILQVCRETHCFESGSTPVRPSNINLEVLGTTSALDN